MKLYKNPAREDWNEIIRRPTKDYGSIEKQVRKILKKVKEYKLQLANCFYFLTSRCIRHLFRFGPDEIGIR